MPPPGNLPDLEIKPSSLTSPVFAGGFFTTSATWEAMLAMVILIKCWHIPTIKKREREQSGCHLLPLAQNFLPFGEICGQYFAQL